MLTKNNRFNLMLKKNIQDFLSGLGFYPFFGRMANKNIFPQDLLEITPTEGQFRI
jgi:hypothetical protein